jgi:hypothetical protein
MTQAKLIKISLVNSIIAALYISAVALLMSNGQKLFGNTNGVFGGIAILMLFVISAAVMGFVILGKPLMMYLDGFKKEALKLFYLTIAWLALIAAMVFIGLVIFK